VATSNTSSDRPITGEPLSAVHWPDSVGGGEGNFLTWYPSFLSPNGYRRPPDAIFPRVAITTTFITSVSTSLKMSCLSSEEPLTIPYSHSCHRKLSTPLLATGALSPPENAVTAPVFPPSPVPGSTVRSRVARPTRCGPGVFQMLVLVMCAALSTGGLATRPRRVCARRPLDALTTLWHALGTGIHGPAQQCTVRPWAKD
jgi:hypothetical protein